MRVRVRVRRPWEGRRDVSQSGALYSGLQRGPGFSTDVTCLSGLRTSVCKGPLPAANSLLHPSVLPSPPVN